MAIEIMGYFMLGLFVLIFFKLFDKERGRNVARKNQGFALTVGGIALLASVAAFAVPAFIGGIWKVFFPPRQVGMPIWGWIMIAVGILVIVKLMASSGRQEVVYAR